MQIVDQQQGQLSQSVQSSQQGQPAAAMERVGVISDRVMNMTLSNMGLTSFRHRVGVPTLAHRFVGLGLEQGDATHLALVVWGLERLMLGACYQDLLDAWRQAGVPQELAIPAGMEARRLWRAGGTRLAPVDPDLQLARWCVTLLAVLLVAQLLLGLAD